MATRKPLVLDSSSQVSDIDYSSDTLPDGVTVVTNTAELGSAITAARSADYGYIKIPSGTTITKTAVTWTVGNNLTIDARGATIDFTSGTNHCYDATGVMGTARGVALQARPSYTLTLDTAGFYTEFTDGTWVMIEDTSGNLTRELNRCRGNATAGGVITLYWAISHNCGASATIRRYSTAPTQNFRLIGGDYTSTNDNQKLFNVASSEGAYNIFVDGVHGQHGGINLYHTRNTTVTDCQWLMSGYSNILGCNNILFDNVQMPANATTVPSQFFRLNQYGGKGFTLSNCSMENCTLDAIVTNRRWLGVFVSHCQFINLGYGISIIASGTYTAANQSWRLNRNSTLNCTGEFNGTPATSYEVNAL
jgi:hypothetical protein